MLDKVKTHLLITGCVRSGTTAVCEFLSQSPTIIVPAEFALYSEWDNPQNYMRVHTIMRARVNNRIFIIKAYMATRLLLDWKGYMPRGNRVLSTLYNIVLTKLKCLVINFL